MQLSISEENVMHDLAMVGPMTSSIEKNLGEIFRSRCPVMPIFQKWVSLPDE